jgi:hypothetical protein
MRLAIQVYAYWAWSGDGITFLKQKASRWKKLKNIGLTAERRVIYNSIHKKILA